MWQMQAQLKKEYLMLTTDERKRGIDIHDVSDIPEDYKVKWHLMDGHDKHIQPKENMQDLADHYAKKLNDNQYRVECDKERIDAFIATDTNNNG
jgi:hypothetical protein